MADAKTTFEGVFDGFLGSAFFGPASKTLTISIESGGTLDPITGDVTGGSTTVYNADGFLRSPMEKEFSNVIGGDMVFTVKQVDLGYTPVFDDTALISGGSTWDGSWQVQEIKGDGADVTYRLLLRR